MFAFSWVWIPVIAILAGMFSEWLKFKEKQSKLGANTDRVGSEVKALKDELASENERLRRRVENLEAIVTSKTWDQISGDPMRESPILADPYEGPDVSGESARDVERIARSIRT